MHEIRTSLKSFHETWHDCPQCGEEWKDDKPTPGVLHSSKLCGLCKSVNRARKERQAKEKVH